LLLAAGGRVGAGQALVVLEDEAALAAMGVQA
jgi:hypothetical protein